MESSEPPETLWNLLRRRKLVQWALAYLADAWVLLQFLDIMAGIYDWPRVVLRVATAVLAIGFVAALVLVSMLTQSAALQRAKL